MRRSHIISFHVMFLSHWLHSCIEMSPEHSISDCALWENWILEMYIRRAETSSAPRSILHLNCHHRKSQVSVSLVSALFVVSQSISRRIFLLLFRSHLVDRKSV